MKLGFTFLLTALMALSLEAAEDFKILHVDDLAKQMESKKNAPTIYDANLESTRRFVGVIPGAHLLSSASDYDVTKELPKEKQNPLVFYCANTLCTASHTAAKRALAAGYKNVSVMVDGIYGWKNAGKPLTKGPESTTAATTSSQSSTGQEAATPVSPQDASALVSKKSAVIVDVRESEERHQVIHGALWYPTTKLKEEQQWLAFRTELPKDKTIIFHCAAGVRAKRMATKLAEEGYKTRFFDGPDQWEKAGLPLENGPVH